MRVIKENMINNKNEDADDRVIFAPVDEIKSIEQVIENLEIVSRELQIVAQGMKPVSNHINST